MNNSHRSNESARGLRRLFLTHLAILLPGLLTGCSSLKLPDVPVPRFVTPYRMEIQQGNFITQEMISQLKPGMTREQVRFVLGSPLVVDLFHATRWDYVFQRALENNRGFEQRKITVFFDNDKLTRIEGDVVPAAAAVDAAAAPAKPADPKEVDKK